MGYQDEYLKWLNSGYLSPDEIKELISIDNDKDEAESRFFAPLSFGTAGLRGVMGLGLNRMNIHVVRQTTQAFADLIISEGAYDKGVGVCFDCRHNSAEFARETACVFAANGIKAYLFENLRPTPELSFAIRHYGLTAGVNITASHNPKQYNGYKVYWSDGAQLPPAHAGEISRRIEKTDIFTGIKRMDYNDAVNKGLIRLLGRETDESFLEGVMSQSIQPEAVRAVADSFKVVFTPFHGTGYQLVPEALKRLGLKHIICVPEQMVVDGSFPTVKSPNPEDKEGFALAKELAAREGASLIIGTDPDADRVGIMQADGEGSFASLSGNQVGVLLLDYVITARRLKGTMPENPATIKSIVTTEMARAVGEANGVKVFDTFTGFKFIAEVIKTLEDEGVYHYIFAYEESYGYLAGDQARDKDAVTTSMLIAEMAAWYFGKGMTLHDALRALFSKYGYYSEQTLNLVMPGMDGLLKMQQLMHSLRAAPPKKIADTPVLRVRDYLNGKTISLENGKAESLTPSGSDMLYFELKDGTRFIVRPSGTEPKIKVYILANGKGESDCADKIERYSNFAHSLKNI